MAINFFRWLLGSGKPEPIEVTCKELFEAAQEYQIRELSFWVCANMVANALGRCEFRTYRDNQEIKEREYYLWNVSPNVNQNSSAFLHKLVAKLYQDNEALVVATLPRGDLDALVVADSWQRPEDWPSRQNEYDGVVVGDYAYQYPVYENQAIHLTLNHQNMRPILNGLYQSYYRMVSAAMKAYTWGSGQHWKVHVNQIAQGNKDWAENFQAMITAQVKPFLESDGAILPEFDGYTYENVGGSAAGDTRDIRAMIARFLTNCIDPLADQLQEEINRKRYGYDGWRRGNYLRVDTSSIIHFDMFANAANVEKLVGSGAFTINDVRRAAGETPINEDWANSYFMTKNISSMDALTRPMGEGGTE